MTERPPNCGGSELLYEPVSLPGIDHRDPRYEDREMECPGCSACRVDRPFDPDELARWAEMYGHPEEWAKKAQYLHGKNERLRGVLLEIASGHPEPAQHARRVLRGGA